MLQSCSVIAFAPTTDAELAKMFYGDVLNLRLVEDDQFALVFDANGTMLRIARVQELSPAPYTILGWKVDDIEESVKELSARGVVFELFEGLPQTRDGIMTFGNRDRVAWFKDPAGNILSISQFA